MIQHRLVWSAESLKPKFSKVSPGAGFKRVFGKQALANFAKGVDLIAMKIREVAREHDIPIVENVPLARALYATVEIDDEIPVEHYHAVAEIIGYVMGLKRGLSTRRM
jgi:flagellar biosynthetic protein FlhB